MSINPPINSHNSFTTYSRVFLGKAGESFLGGTGAAEGAPLHVAFIRVLAAVV
jgi:hypothetical protein